MTTPVRESRVALAAYERVRTTLVLVLPALAISLAVLLAGQALAGGATQALVVTGMAAALAGLFLVAAHATRGLVPVPARAVPARAEAQAPTPHWCHVAVPRRPARPRAPGRG